jgi:hypothetical protein
MKMILTSTTKRLAAVLAHFHGMRASRTRPEGFEHVRRRHVPLLADPSRIPAYLRCRRLPLRIQSQFDAKSVNLETPGHLNTRTPGHDHANLGRDAI